MLSPPYAMKFSVTVDLLFQFVVLTALAPTAGHLAFYEPERLRQTNFDLDASSKNPFSSLAASYFAAWDPLTEDFSFEKPFYILESLQMHLLADESRSKEASIFVESRLHDITDVDWYLLNKTDDEVFTVLGYPLVPACRSLKDFYPTLAFVAPIGTQSVAPISNPVVSSPTIQLPFQLPDGYGVKMIVQEQAGLNEERPTYYEPQTNFEWFLPMGYETHPCVESFWKCLENPNVFVANITQPGQYYFAIYHPDWNRRHRRKRGWKRIHHGSTTRSGSSSNGPTKEAEIYDFGFVTGTQDHFLMSDWSRLAVLAQFISSGRTLAQTCESPYD